MKKRIILSVIIILVGVAGFVAFMYLGSFHKVAVSFGDDVSGATVYKEKGDQIEKLSAAKDLSLQNGDYYAISEGERVSKDKIHFTVKDTDIALKLDPGYSVTYLGTLLESEQVSIESTAEEAFPLIATDYTITNGTLYGRGDWFGALLIKNVTDERDIRDYYRILLHKEAGEWKVVNKPELVLTKSEFKGVPEKVINAVNQLSE